MKLLARNFAGAAARGIYDVARATDADEKAKNDAFFPCNL